MERLLPPFQMAPPPLALLFPFAKLTFGIVDIPLRTIIILMMET
jgi:hypothetical protein